MCLTVGRYPQLSKSCIGFYKPVAADPAPEGYRVVSTSAQLVDGAPKYVHELEVEPPPTAEELKALAAALRLGKRGHDRHNGESQAMINGAYNLAKDDPEAVIRFKSPAEFVTLDAGTMIAIGRAMGRHVQACFALEGDAIEGRAITTVAQVEAAFA